MRCRKVIVGIAAAGLALSSVASASPAGASGTQDYCPVDRVCLWFNSNSAGARADFRLSDASLSDELFNDGPVGANGWLVQVEDNSASFHNRSGNVMWFYERRNCNTDGTVRRVVAGGRDNFGDPLKNKVSSMFIVALGGCVDIDQSGA
jgi:hypothetical protein